MAETVDMNDVYSNICGMRTLISFQAKLALLKDFYDVTACASLDEQLSVSNCELDRLSAKLTSLISLRGKLIAFKDLIQRECYLIY